ncbi:FecR family protein, partial [Bacteroidota bacterium]
SQLSKTINSKKAFDKFKSRINKDKSKGKHIYLNIIKVAAVLVIIIGIWQIFNYYSKVKLYELSSGNDEGISINLSDNSFIELNKNSTLYYPKKFRKNLREVNFEGEAYFDIQDLDNNPFIINIGDFKIKVLGTSFNVYAYRNKDIIEVTVDTGKVLLSDSLHEKLVKSGEKVTYNKKAIDKFIIDTIENQNHIAWKTGLLEFNEANLNEVIEILNKTYQTSIIVEDNELNDLKLTANFNNRPINFIFEILKLNFDIEIKKVGEDYIFSKRQTKGDNI